MRQKRRQFRSHGAAVRRSCWLTRRCRVTVLTQAPRLTCAVALLLLVVSGLVVCFYPPPHAEAQTPADELSGVPELKKGDYENAVKLLTARLATNPSDVDAQKYLLRAHRETGHYNEAEAAAKKFLLKSLNAAAVQGELAEIFSATGRYTEAISEFERAGGDAKTQTEKLAADLRRAELLDLVGQETQAHQLFASFVNYFNDKQPESAPELTLVARALVHLEKFQDANDVYRSAIEADSTYIDAQLGAAELYTTKYDYADATQFLREALAINPNSARAHLNVALNKRLDGDDEMRGSLNRALAINPNLVEALALKAELALEAGQFAPATIEIDRALKINPRSLESHSLRAASLYLQDRDFETEIAATRAINPHYGAIFNTLSHFATITRRTAQAAEFARRAIALSPNLWDAHLSLGMAMLRLGQMPEGRTEVEIAFKGDPFNVWAKNTLDLLDVMKDYRETRRDPFLVKADPKESDVLSGYAAGLLLEAAAKLTAKYRFKPQGPITIELFPNHEDFAVRTLGLPGLGALGVCFGQVVALDSPSARESGEFNWGSTLWHEYTHVITLQMTDYRIPRWFSEGLSVYEERGARPGWGDEWNPMVLQALSAGHWFKISDLDAGFQRPRTPQDVPIAYFEASKICDFIVDRFGFEAILGMLALYRDKAHTPEILQQVLKLSESEFDRAFMSYIEAKARPLQEALTTEPSEVAAMNADEVLRQAADHNSFALHLRAGKLLQERGDNTAAAEHFKRSIALFPYFTGEGNAYEALAMLLEKRGDLAQAADVTEALINHDEKNGNALKNLVRLRLALGDRPRALAALRLSFYVDPFAYAAHTQLGELSLEAKDYPQALAEFQTTLALQPPNMAEANYNVAAAYHLLGRQPEAKHAVLRALETAPRFEKAQELLLKITGQ